MHLAVVTWEAFLTLFHTIKTTSICQVHAVTPKHIESDSFFLMFSGHSLSLSLSVCECVCEILDMNLDTRLFQLTILAESQAWKHAGINKETFGLHQAILASVAILIKAFKNPQTTQTSGWGFANKHINTYPLIGVKQATNLVTARRGKKKKRS